MQTEINVKEMRCVKWLEENDRDTLAKLKECAEDRENWQVAILGSDGWVLDVPVGLNSRCQIYSATRKTEAITHEDLFCKYAGHWWKDNSDWWNISGFDYPHYACGSWRPLSWFQGREHSLTPPAPEEEK